MAETITPTGRVIEPGTPTQVAHPWRAVLRVIVAAAVGVILSWLVRWIGLDLVVFSEQIVDSVTYGAVLAGTALFQWLLTRPGLQGFWQALGLGTGVHTEQPAEVDHTPPPAGWTPQHRAEHQFLAGPVSVSELHQSDDD